MKGLTLTAAPTAEPVALGEAKAHLRVDASDDDALIADVVAAARQAAEAHTRRALVTQSWRLTLDRFPGRPLPWWDGVREGVRPAEPASAIELPRPPLASVTAITVFDSADNPTTVPAGDYFVDTNREPGRIVLRTGKTWPAVGRVAGGVHIDFIAGYGNASAVPHALRRGILLLVGHLYENREAVALRADAVELPLGVAALWRPYRVLGL